MPNPSTPNQQQCDWSLPVRAIDPDSTHFQAGYQQALTDFAISNLLHRLKTYSATHFNATWATLNPSETETLAAILIQTLTANLNGNLLVPYLTAIRHPSCTAG